MPPTNLIDESLGWLVVAFGGMALGLVGLLRKRPMSPWWLAGVAAALLGLAAGALALGLPGSVVLALAALAGVLALRVGCHLSVVRRAGARAGTLLASPRFRAGLLVAAGAGIAVWQVVRFDRAVEAELLQTDEVLAALAEPVDLSPVPDRVALTDTGRPVPLFAALNADPATAAAERDQLRRMDLDRHLIQTGGPDRQYNCHGWVFTGGRYWVRGAYVETVLKENGYKAVTRPAANDLAVFRNEAGDVTHTALVRSVTAEGAVLLESKWGQLGRYLHNDTRHAYAAGTGTYYRSARPGHVLRGLDYQQRPARLANGT
jgi:hypothetical protein